jgi:hypothetical protein
MEEVGLRLEEDPEYRTVLVEVRRELAPLRALETAVAECQPPPGLAERTARFVFAEAAKQRPARRGQFPLLASALAAVPADSREGAPGSLVPAVPQGKAAAADRTLSPCPMAHAKPSRIRWIDAAVAAAVLILISAVIWPAVYPGRVRARLVACQDNLRELGTALTAYSRNHDDRFPAVPAEGPLAAAGVYAPLLVSDGYLGESRRVLCPESPLVASRDFQIPSVEEFQSMRQEEAARMRRQMGGSYGYCIGHLEHGRLVATKNLGRSYFAVMADAPSDVLADHQSLNHGGRGQNVLLEDGHVAFVTTSRLAGSADDIFANDDQQVSAGIHVDDSVIAGSATPPLIQVNYH